MKLSIDFDGVLCRYVPGKGMFDVPCLMIPPVKGASEWLRNMIANHECYITSCRASTPEGISDIRNYLVTILHVPYTAVVALPVSQTKPIADLYIDDHAFRFEGIFPQEAELEELSNTWLQDNDKLDNDESNG